MSIYRFRAFSTDKELSRKKCVPCNSKDIRPMVERSTNGLMPQVPGWNLVNESGTLKLQRSWKAKTFMKGLELLHAVTDIAEAEEVQAMVESIPDESEFIEVGYISNVHGLNGQLRVKSMTDFPEMRFTTPGTRWLRLCVSGKETIQEVELLEGRGHPGQKSWILSFMGIDTVDKARSIVGSTLLVRRTDRPALQDGEFYIPDLIGMRVILKETGKSVGTVVNVFNSGASDLLRVMLNSAQDMLDHCSSLEAKSDVPGSLVWVPFVEAIVPDVDLNKREMLITPPKGLLELNVRADGMSKKERRRLVWKQRMEAQQHFISAKKKLNELGQHHVIQGFSFGDKAQNNLLRNQVLGINFKLFKHAIQNIEVPSRSYNSTDFVTACSNKLVDNTLILSSEENKESNHYMDTRGLQLISEGKVGIVLVNPNNHGSDCDAAASVGCGRIQHASSLLLIQELLSDKRKERVSIPLIIISTAWDIQSSQQLLLENDYYGLDPKKVWFLEEEMLPVVSCSLSEEKTHKILLKSPWEIIQSPVGSGGVISKLSGDMIEILADMGVQYVEVCSLRQGSAIGHLPSFGFMESRNADIGVKIIDDKLDDFSFDIIFSMRFLKEMTKHIDKLPFHRVARCHSYVEKVDKKWVKTVPTSSNSYGLHCSIYSCLNISSPDKICLVQIGD